MYSVEPDGAAPRGWRRRRIWPWWVALALGAALAVPALRMALTSETGQPGGSANAASAAGPATGYAPGQTGPGRPAGPATGFAPGAGATGYGPGVGATQQVQEPVKVAVTIAAPADGLPEGWIMTASGPLGPADKEFLVKVRTAGLWEGPAGQMAQTRAGSNRVKEVGTQLLNDHRGLDQQVRQVSAQLGVALPDKPSDEQQGWLNEMNPARGAEFDSIFANRLRAAHGKVFALVSSIRSGTRNDAVRAFAQTAVNVVMKHMTLLESIGNVDFNALPTPGLPATNAKQQAAPIGDWQPNAVWAVAGLALAVGGVAAFRIYRGSRAARRRPAF
jgi:predicted outer membrane protein